MNYCKNEILNSAKATKSYDESKDAYGACKVKRCENGFKSLWLQIIAENLLKNNMASRGAALLHSCSFIYQKKSIVLCGWGGAGKTNTLIQFLLDGAQYMGDDLSLITETGELLPYPKRLNILDYNMKCYPDIFYKHLTPKIKKKFNNSKRKFQN